MVIVINFKNTNMGDLGVKVINASLYGSVYMNGYRSFSDIMRDYLDRSVVSIDTRISGIRMSDGLYWKILGDHLGSCKRFTLGVEDIGGNLVYGFDIVIDSCDSVAIHKVMVLMRGVKKIYDSKCNRNGKWMYNIFYKVDGVVSKESNVLNRLEVEQNIRSIGVDPIGLIDDMIK